MRKDAFISGLLKARGFAVPKGERNLVMAALDYDLVPSGIDNFAGPVTRNEAISWAIHSLGLSFESSLLTGIPLPFKDVGKLEPSERGAVAAALNMKPPLLKKGVSNFGPDVKITPKEGESILATVKAASRSLALTVRSSPEKGMTVHIDRRGAISAPPKWRALVNGFDTREEAEAFRSLMTAKNVEGTVDSQNYDWRVRSILSDRYGPIREFLEAARGEGREGVVFTSPLSWEKEDVPKFWAMITLDPARFTLRPIFAPQGLSVLAPLSSMTGGTAAAINGGFFTISGKEQGSPIGALLSEGMFINPPYKGRTCIGWNDQNKAAFGHLECSTKVTFPEGGYMEITAFNREVKGSGVVLFTSHFGQPTPLFKTQGIELLLDGKRIEEIRTSGGNSIPEGRRVLGVYGHSASLLSSLREGDILGIDQSINGDDPYWGSMTQAIQGGPFLIRKGQIVIEDEILSDSVVNRRHPRTVMGLTAKGQWFFF
ncbi:MAG: phosphodiester glycosidase family protein, partial [Synergistaceae bacterium]|nr:phosphodiester glycosidase family protein [Synergistaceae bacterium]